MFTVQDAAAAHMGMQIAQRLLFTLIEKNIFTPKEASEMLRGMAASNRTPGSGPANLEAAKVLDALAKNIDSTVGRTRH